MSSKDDEIEEVFTDEHIKQIKESISFFGKEGAAKMFKISVDTINKVIYGTTEYPTNKCNFQIDRTPRTSRENLKSDCNFRRSSTPPYYDRNERSLNKRKYSDRDYERNDRIEKRPSLDRTTREKDRFEERSRDRSIERLRDRNCNYMNLNCRSGGLDNQRDATASINSINEDPKSSKYFEAVESDTDVIYSSEDDNTEILKKEENSIQTKWVSTYIKGSVSKNQNQTVGLNSINNFIYNSFGTLIKAKKRFIDTENLVSVIKCNLVSNANDIYLHSNHSRYMNERSVNKNYLNVTLLLGCSSNGLKFKPAFILNHINLNRPLIQNDDIEHVQNQEEWINHILKPELEKNMIHNCICATDNEEFYLDDVLREKFNQLNCDLIVIPNSLAQKVSPFQHSIFLTLNGILHKIFLGNKSFPTNLDTSIQFFQNAWKELTEEDIINSFYYILNTCLGDD